MHMHDTTTFWLQLLLQTRLTHVVQKGKTELLLDQIKVLMAGCDYSIIELYHMRSFTSVSYMYISCTLLKAWHTAPYVYTL